MASLQAGKLNDILLPEVHEDPEKYFFTL